jgi:two-component system response regulator DegU
MRADQINILLVDDHQMMREGVRRMLAEQPGMRVVSEAASGPAALEQARAAVPDVVVMDVHLPGEDGIATSARIRSEFPSVRIVVLSADTDLVTVRRALQTGFRATSPRTARRSNWSGRFARRWISGGISARRSRPWWCRIT